MLLVLKYFLSYNISRGCFQREMSHRFKLWNSRLEHWRLWLFVPLPSLPLTWCTMGLYREDQDSTPLCQALLKAFPSPSVNQHTQTSLVRTAWPLMSYNPTFSCLNAAGFLVYSSVRNFVSLNMSHGYGYTLLPIVITFEINEVVLYMEDSFLFPSFQNVYKIRFEVGVQRQDSVTYIVTSSQMFISTEDRQPACW